MGGMKKRRKVEKKGEENGSGSSLEKEGSVDWWDEFSKKIKGEIFIEESCCFESGFLEIYWHCSG